MRGKWRKMAKENRGMSFVEVLCAVAIFSFVVTIVGTVIVYSTRTYQKGVQETSVQQEAQLAANNIGNIVKDACSVLYGKENGQFLRNGEPEYEADGVTEKKHAGDTTELFLDTNDGMQYCIRFEPTQNALFYIKSNLSDPSLSESSVLARNVTAFSADTTDFSKNRTIKLDMKVEDSGRSIPMTYTMTSRNELASNVEFNLSPGPAIIFLETNPILVPGESYHIPIAVSGELPVGGLDATIVSKDGSGSEVTDDTKRLKIGALTMDYVEVIVPKDTPVVKGEVTVLSAGTLEDGSHVTSDPNTVGVRQVSAINVPYAVDRTQVADGTYEGAKAKYTFWADAVGTNLVKQVGYSYDFGYRKAQAVYWSYELTVDGHTYTYSQSPKYDGDGKLQDEGTESYSDRAGAEQYIKIVPDKTKGYADRPYFTIELVQAMKADFVLEVTATSRHALGENKYDSKYPNDATTITGKAQITPRDTYIKGGNSIIIEPNQECAVPVTMMGGLTSNVTFEYDGNTDSSTQASFRDGKVYIKLGKDEKGLSADAGERKKNTFDVIVKNKKNNNTADENTKKITVCVRRVESMTFDCTPDPETQKPVAGAQYKLVATLMGAFLDKDASEEVADYLPNPYAVKFDWKVVKEDSNGTKKTLVGTEGSEIWTEYHSSGTKTSTAENAYFKVVSLGADSEQPYMNIEMKQKLPTKTTIVVTATALHPEGEDGLGNFTNKASKDAGLAVKYESVSAEVSIEGKGLIDVASPLAVVEPGQGSNTQTDKNVLNVPIKVNGTFDHLEVKMVGNTSGTSLATYSKTPYKTTRTDPDGSEIWEMGLVISKDEKGKPVKDANGNPDYTGLIDVTITPYIDKNTPVEEEAVTTQLALRRVKEVEIGATAANPKPGCPEIITYPYKDPDTGETITCPYHSGGCRHLSYDYINKDETITLSGNASGFGTDWKKYFEKQESGDDNYLSPYPVEWKVYDDKGVAHDLSYYGTVTEDKDAGTISIKFTKRIPNGSEIRAISLHAAGNNKSGKKYEDVIGTLYVKIIDTNDDYDVGPLLDNVMRGQEFGNAEDRRYEFPDAEGNYCVYDNANKAGYGWGNWYYRTREILGKDENGNNLYGEWTMYHRNQINESGQAAMRLNQEDTQTLLPDRMYQLELAFMCIDQGSKTIKWPRDKALLAAGTGFEGFSIEGGVSTNKKSDYTNTYNIGRGSIRFSKDKVQIGDEYDYIRSIGSVEAPITDASYTTPLYGHSLYWMHYQHKSYTRWEILKNNKWVVVTPSGLSASNSQTEMKITRSTDAPKGLYRVSNGIRYKNEKAEWRVWDGKNPWDNGGNFYKQLYNTDYLLCGSDGKAGYIYYEVQ